MKGLLLLHEKALTGRCANTTADLIALEWQLADKDDQGGFVVILRIYYEIGFLVCSLLVFIIHYYCYWYCCY